jgi:hypothetical protein
MQVLNPDQMAQYWSKVRASGRVRRQPFPSAGVGYSMNDPHTFPQEQVYSERLVFGSPAQISLDQLPNSGALISLNNTLNKVDSAVAAANARPGSVGGVSYGAAGDTGLIAGFVNRDRFTVTPFVTAAASVQVLAQNEKRSGLLIQNQSATLTLFFNLGSAAGANIGIQLAAGQGVLFDIVVPNNYVTVSFVGGNGFGVVAEGSRL